MYGRVTFLGCVLSACCGCGGSAGTDAGMLVDSGFADSSISDSATSDSSTRDVGVFDAAAHDAATLDVSAGDASASDAGSTDAAPPDAAVDACDALPAGPLAVQEFVFVGAPLDGNSFDLTFSNQGTIVVRDGTALVTIAPNGDVAPVVTNTTLPTTYGLRWTPAGDVIAAAGDNGSLRRMDGAGTVTPFGPAAQLAQGVFVSTSGLVFYTDFLGSEVAWLDSAGAPSTSVATGANAPQPTAVLYDPSRDLAFFASYSGQLWRVEVSNLANPGTPQLLREVPAQSTGDTVGLTGLALDTCGNLYIVDQNEGAAGTLFRQRLDAQGGALGALEVLVAAFPAQVSSAAFAQGPGWQADSTKLFVVGVDGRIFTVDVGVVGALTPATL